MVDVLEQYINKVEKRLDAPKVFIEASAYHIVSSLLGRYFRCAFVPGTPSIGFRPNTWFLLSSIPARTRRSTVINYSTDVYKKTLEDHILTVTKTADNKEKAIEYVDDTIIEEGSPEGIMDHIDATSKETGCYSIISSEFGSVLSNIQNKDYQKGVSTLLSKLYYGESGTVMLSQRGKDKKGGDPNKGKRHMPEGLYVTMFAAMQEPKYYLSPIMVGQGLMRRIVLLYVKSADMSMDTWIPPLDMRAKVEDEFVDNVTSIGNLMKNYYEMTGNIEGRYKLIETAFLDMKFINDIAKKNDEKLLDEESFYNIYMQGYWEHLTKISMLHAIARSSIVERISSDPFLQVSREDTRKAHDFLQRATKYSQEAIDNLGYVDVVMKDVTEPLNRVYNFIKEHQDGLERFVLYRKINIPREDLDSLVSQLITQEKIAVEIKQTGGRPAIIYKVIS